MSARPAGYAARHTIPSTIVDTRMVDARSPDGNIAQFVHVRKSLQHSRLLYQLKRYAQCCGKSTINNVTAQVTPRPLTTGYLRLRPTLRLVMCAVCGPAECCGCATSGCALHVRSQEESSEGSEVSEWTGMPIGKAPGCQALGVSTVGGASILISSPAGGGRRRGGAKGERAGWREEREGRVERGGGGG